MAHWDGTVEVYQVVVNQPHYGGQPTGKVDQMAMQKLPAAILGLSWQLDQAGILMGCADNNIYKWDL